MTRFGSSVTVVDRGERLLPREDEDVAAELRKLLEAEGVRFVLGATVDSVAGRSGDAVVVQIDAATGKETIKATQSSPPPAGPPTRMGSDWKRPASN